MEHVGFLGVGRMGAAIAARMIEAGTPLTVWNRSPNASVDALTSAGASVAVAAREALALPISFSMLADDSAADAVLSRENIGFSATERVHVNMASVSAELADLLARRFADAGAQYVASPVLGRPEVASRGQLNALVAGGAEVVDRIEGLLTTCAARVWRLGEIPRQANAVKISMNYMLLHALESMGEAIALVEAEGVTAEDFADLFTHTFFGGAVHSTYGPIIARRRYSPPGFTLPLGLKDLGLAERLASRSNVDLGMADVLRARFEAALSDPELADLDWSAVAEISRIRRHVSD